MASTSAELALSLLEDDFDQLEYSDESLANLSLGGLLKAHGILPTCSDLEQMTGDLQPAADDIEQITGNFQPTADDLEQITGDFQPTADDLEQITGDLQPAADNLEQIIGDLQPAADNLERITGDLQPAADDLDLQLPADATQSIGVTTSASVEECDKVLINLPCDSIPLKKPPTACSNSPSVDEERPVDYSRLSLSPPPLLDELLEAPLSPCILDSPVKSSLINDSGYLSSNSPTSSTPSSTSPFVLSLPDYSAMESVYNNWTPKPACQPAERPEDSYTAMIGRALLSSADGEMVLADIYNFILEHYPYYHQAKPTWRSAVRHNLSAMECFVRGRRAKQGRGYYWSIHPACRDRFHQGVFSRRTARRAAQQYSKTPTAQRTTAQRHRSSTPNNRITQPAPVATTSVPAQLPACGYVTMTTTPVQPSNQYVQPSNNFDYMATPQQQYVSTQAQCAQLLGYGYYGNQTYHQTYAQGYYGH